MTGRFAPTPSGRMHMGNAYAMLAAWLSARARHELILLRIEDIDAPRAVPDADRWIMDDLTWLGLDWDGEPVYQSQRLDLYEVLLYEYTGSIWTPIIAHCIFNTATLINILYPGILLPYGT